MRETIIVARKAAVSADSLNPMKHVACPSIAAVDASDAAAA